MSRYRPDSRSRRARDRRVVLSTVGVMVVAGAATLIPMASNAAPGDPTRLASRSQDCDPATVAAQATAAPSSGRRTRGGQADCSTQNSQNTQEVAAVDGSVAGDATDGGAGADGGNGTRTGAGDTATGDNANRDAVAGAATEPQPAEGLDPAAPAAAATPVNPTSTEQPVGQQRADGNVAPAQDFLGNSCAGSGLQAHTGLQDGNRCVSTAFGEVGAADSNPSLMITSAPQVTRANRPFDLRVSTRNLIRDRFLAAAAGGYYKESSFLRDGIVRGHFHTACRMLGNRRAAPDPAPVPAFFVATEDKAGGRTPDTVTVRVSGLPRGVAQCAVWAGDGSHRVPMMQRANQIPAFDVVRIVVR